MIVITRKNHHRCRNYGKRPISQIRRRRESTTTRRPKIQRNTRRKMNRNSERKNKSGKNTILKISTKSIVFFVYIHILHPKQYLYDSQNILCSKETYKTIISNKPKKKATKPEALSNQKKFKTNFIFLTKKQKSYSIYDAHQEVGCNMLPDK